MGCNGKNTGQIDSGLLLKEVSFTYRYAFIKSENNFKDLWRLKTTTREALRAWLMAGKASGERGDAIAGACSELMENSIKYSPIGSPF